MTKEEKILSALKEMDNEELIDIWNQYCDETRDYNGRIESMEYLNDLYSGYTPLEVAQRIRCGHDDYGTESEFNPHRSYFYLNGYDNPVSIDYVTWISPLDKWPDSPLGIGVDDLVDYIVENEEGFSNDTLEAILDGE